MNMDIELHVDDLIPGFVLGTLEDDEMLRAARHLASCRLCSDEMARYAALVGKLTAAAPEAIPPGDLWERLSAKVAENPAPQTERTRRPSLFDSLLHRALFAPRSRLLQVWAVVSLVLIVALSASTVTLLRLHAGASPRTAVLPTFELFAASAAPEARGMLVASSNGEEGTLIVDGLASLGDGRRYQLWLMGHGRPVSGALFEVEKEGYATVIVHAPKPLTDYHAFSITVEPSLGSNSPSGPKVLATRAPSQ